MKRLQSPVLHWIIVLGLLALLLLLGDVWCYQQALPVEINVQGNAATLYVGSQALSIGPIPSPTMLEFVAKDPSIHEYQLDDTDSTNNYTLDPTYLSQIASSPYYRFQSWMRDLDGTSQWHDLRIWDNGQPLGGIAWPANGARVTLPSTGLLRVNVSLQRPETPMTLNLIAQNGEITHITLDRNGRRITVTRFTPGFGDNQPVTSSFFPMDTVPFAAMVIDSLIRTLLWAILIIVAIVLAEIIAGLIGRARGIFVGSSEQGTGEHHFFASMNTVRASPASTNQTWYSARSWWGRLTQQIHPSGLIALGASFLFVAWIASVQYNGEPHIFDADAYLFAAKMYAMGKLSVPLPPAVDRFPGPFMVQFDGRWFGQYAPGTSLTLVPGIWLGVPWLIEPILGTLTLLGIGLIAARLYNRRVATLAIILGVLSPFYSYLAASYLSHSVALFYLVWGTWLLLRFLQGGTGKNLLIATLLFGIASLTRDQVALLYMVIVLPGLLLLSWRQARDNWRRWFTPVAISLFLALFFLGISLGFNKLLTGNPFTPPRLLFFAGDHWGFGTGVGFYGEHTLAAGFVNLDELLTSLNIDLFGWPFYFTLAFLAIPFLTRRAVAADWLLLAGAVIMTSALIGYFYHGIYLGPRYLYETLPFLLILTARGILSLAATAREIRAWVSADLSPIPSEENTAGQQERVKHIGKTAKGQFSAATVALVIGLVLCNLLYFLPRQLELHQNYTGLPNGFHIDLQAVYHPPFHHAIVVTGDPWIYPFVLFPLNDPELHGDVLYAMASNPGEYDELRQAFPGRVLYRLDVDPNGTVHYVELQKTGRESPRDLSGG